jgi:hypothetical protein
MQETTAGGGGLERLTCGYKKKTRIRTKKDKNSAVVDIKFCVPL